MKKGNSILRGRVFCFMLAMLCTMGVQNTFAQGIAQIGSSATLPVVANTSKMPSGVSKGSLEQAIRKSENTIKFTENKGQWNPQVIAIGNTNVGDMVVKKNELYFLSTMKLEEEGEDEEAEEHRVAGAQEEEHEEEGEEIERAVAHGWGITFDGFNPNFTVEKGNEFTTKYNYFQSPDKSKWASNVSAFGEMTLKDIYDGVDLRLYSQKQGRVEFDWVVNAGASFSNIKMRFKGQDNLSIDKDGNLSVKLRFDDVKFDIPEAYQLIDGKKVQVKMAFKIEGNAVSFKTVSGKVDNRYPLIIDPSLKWGVWMDGNNVNGTFDEYLFAVDVDNAGNVYCGGAISVQLARSYIGSAIYGYDSTYNENTVGSNADHRDGVIYKIKADGTALMNVTYYGSSSPDAIYGLNVSPDNSRVFVSGYCRADLPISGTAATAFDNSRDGTDGFVAVFNANLNQLLYATYVGGTGTGSSLGAPYDRMVSIRAINNTDFVVGGRVNAALPTTTPNYIVNAYDNSFGGTQEVYIAKFTGLNTLSWGTYVGGSDVDDLNDLQLFSNGDVAFCGQTASSAATFPGLVNQSGSMNASTVDGIVGVIPSAGGTFSMLSRIGGSSNDQFNGLTIGIGDTIYLTGFTESSNYPLGNDSSSLNRFRATSVGNDDGIIGKMPKLGKTGAVDPWKATYFGGTNDDRGNTIRTYGQGSAVMVFGETGSNPKTNAAPNEFPVKNLNLAGNTFYDSTFNGSTWDIFWLALSTDLNTQLFGTYVGGSRNDYLGETGVPAGSNHFVVEGDSLIVLGTTSHSTTLEPTIIGPASGAGAVFDATRASDNNDVHLVFKWRIGALFTYDYGDAPSSYGTGRHNILGNIKLGTLEDAEDFYPVTPGTKANVDDNTASDDEDAISGTQILIQDTATRYSVTIPITNTTGTTAIAAAWIDFNRNGTFDAGEVDTNRIANGATTTTFSWTGINWTSGSVDTSYMRIRITTDAQAFVANPPQNVNYSDGEVEDYLVIRYHCLNLTSSVTTKTDPASCAATNGTITVTGGLTANTAYIVNYKKNNTNVGPVTITTNGSGALTITGLGAGLYTSINIAHPTNTSCGDTAKPILLVDPSIGTPVPTATPSTVCSGDTFVLSATGKPGAVFNWTGPNSFAATGNPIVRPNATTAMQGTYTVTQTDSGCTSQSATVSVTVNTTPGAPTNVTASPNPICSGGTLTLSATAAGTLNWTFPDSAGIRNGNPYIRNNVTTAMSGTYTVTQTQNGCTSRTAGSVVVTVNQTPAAPTANATPNPLCTGDTLTLTATNVTGGATITWSYPDGGGATGNPVRRNGVTTSMSGNYTVTQTVTGCTSAASAPVNVTVNPRPVISNAVGTNPTTCGGTDGFITISGLTTGQTYSVTYNFNATPQSASGLVASGGQIILTGLAAGAYTNIRVTSAASCTSAPFAGTVTLNSPASPVTPTVTSNTPVCENDTIKLFLTNPAANATFSWTGPASFTSAAQNPVRPLATTGMSGSYCATQTVANCPSAQACTNVTVNPRPVISGAVGTNPTTCGGTNGFITIGGLTPGTTVNVSYLRNGLPQTRTGLLVDINGQVSITNLNQASYSNIVVTLNGCSSTPFAGTVSLTDPTIPNTPAVSSNSPVCAGDTVKLFLNNPAIGATFSWTTTAANSFTSTAQNPVRPNATTTMGGNYCVTQTVANCVSNSGCAIVIVNPKPVIASLIGSDPTTCGGLNGSITVTGLNNNQNYTIRYFKDNVDQGSFPFTSNGSGQILIGTLGAGTYNNFVIISSLTNCISLPFSGQVILSDPTKPQPPSLSSSTPCEADTLKLFATGEVGATYSWTGPGFTSPLQNPIRLNANIASMAGQYCATQTVNNCVSDPTCINVSINARPIANAGTDTTICSGKQARIGGNPTATGGTPNYNYAWTGGLVPISAVSNPVVSPATTATYTVKVTDNNGCTATDNVAVNVNQAPVANAGPDKTLIGCDTVGINIGGVPTGSSPFTYQWSPPAGLNSTTIQTPLVKSIGDTTDYTVIVTDNNGCTASDDVTVFVVGSSISVSISGATTEWCELTNGSVQLTANPVGGQSPYTYSWTGQNISPTNAQQATASPNLANTYTYSVVVTDFLGCQAGNTYTITVNPKPIADAGPDVTICNGQTDTLGGKPTASGGTGPNYTYQWDNGAGTDANPVVSPSGTTTYSVTVTDSKTCTNTDQVKVTVNQNPVANAGLDKDLPSCSPTGLTIGGSPTASGGGGLYNYSWTPTTGLFTSSSSNPVVIVADTTTYTVLVTDNNGCTASDQVTVNVIERTPTATISANGTKEWCAGSNGSVTFTATMNGGTTPVSTYNWSGSNLSPTNAQQATANPNTANTYAYFVTITDAFNCTAIATDTVIVDALPIADAGADTTVCSASSVVLGGNPTASGGTPGYTYAWTGGSTAANPTVNPTSTTPYTVTVTDSKGCKSTDVITVSIRLSPTADAGPDVTLPSCSPTGVKIGGSPAGKGGSGDPFTYSWSPIVGLSDPTAGNPTVTGLIQDTTYTLIVSDANGCTASDQVLVRVTTNTLTATVTSSSGITEYCANVPTNTNLTANLVGGIAPLTYAWSGTPTANPTNTQITTVNPSTPGAYVYSVLITDAFNCTATGSITITVDSVPTASAGPQGGFSVCSGSSIQIGGNPTATGGTPNYTYAWSNGATPEANPTVTPASSGAYIVTVTDSHLCTATAITIVNVKPNPGANAGPDVNLPTCSPTGIKIGGSPTAFGGTAPYTYSWTPNVSIITNSSANPTVLGLANDTTYTVLVTDSLGCTATDAVVVHVVNNTPIVNITSSGPTSKCFGVLGASNLTANVTGGTIPVGFAWNGADIVGPTNTQVITVNPTSVGTHTYDVVITDAFNCTATNSITITIDSIPTADAGGVNGVFTTCAGASVTLGGNPTATGGTPGYTYVWSGGAANVANPVVSPVGTTTYNLTVTDSKLCSATATTTVQVNPKPVADAGPDKTVSVCSGDSVTIGGNPFSATGGTGPYRYQWSPSTGLSNDTIANPVVKGVGGAYTLLVTDASGCTATDVVVVTLGGNSLQVDAGLDRAVCEGICSQLGTFPTAVGGTAPYTYVWTGANLNFNNVANPVACPSATTTYYVLVTDSKGCTGTDSVTVTFNPNPKANAGPDTSSCLGTGIAIGGTPTATGGTPGYTYKWDPTLGLSSSSVANPTATPQVITTYTILVTDSKGCVSQDDVIVTPRENPIADAGPDKTLVACSGDSVRIGGSPTAKNGTSPYTYLWSPTVNSGITDTLAPNPYVKNLGTDAVLTVKVTDIYGCTATDQVFIDVTNSTMVVEAGSDAVICANSNASVTLGGSPTITGGTPPYTYTWTPTAGLDTSNKANPVAKPTQSTTYYVQIVDAKGCIGQDSVRITIAPQPTVFAGLDDTVCAGSCIILGGDSLRPTASGGTAPYIYDWTINTLYLSCVNCANPVSCPLSDVTYRLVVTDSFGCTNFDDVSLKVSNLRVSAGADKTICAGNSVQLDGSVTGVGGPYSVSWSPGGSTILNPVVSPSVTTTYIITAYDSIGCTKTDTVVVNVNPAVQVASLPDTTICTNGGNVTLGGNPTASGGTPPYRYNWSPGISLSSATVANPTLTNPLVGGTWCVTVTDTAGCSASACQTVTINPAVTADAGPDISMTNCANDSAVLGGSPAGKGGTNAGALRYTWSPDSVGGVKVLFEPNMPNPIVHNVPITTTFTLTVTDTITGCSNTDQVKVTIVPTSLQADAGADIILCGNSTTCVKLGGTPTAIGGTPGYTYNWSPVRPIQDDPTVANPCALPLVTTTFFVTVTDSKGCQSIDSTVVRVDEPLIVNAGTDTTVCFNQPVQLGGAPTASGGDGSYNYVWSPSGLTPSITVANPTVQHVTANSNYTVVVTDGANCSASATINITVRDLPKACAGPDVSIFPCSGDSAILGCDPTGFGTTGPYSYSWTPPFDISLNCLTCPNPVVDSLGATTIFTVTVTDSFGCSNTDDVQVTVLPKTIFVNAKPVILPTLCSNGLTCVTLGGLPSPVSGGIPPYFYHWFYNVPDSFASNPTVCPKVTTTYTLIGTDSKGCQASDTVRVIVNEAPVASITGLNSQYCVDAGNVTMTGVPAGGTFSGPGVTGNIFQPKLLGVGNYCIKYAYTDPATGCSDDTTICVTVNPLPVVVINGGNPTNYCLESLPVIFTATPAGGTFTGRGVVPSGEFTAANAGIGSDTITYTYTDPITGCSNFAQVIINVNTPPTISITASADTVCRGASVTLTPTYSLGVGNVIWRQLGGGQIGGGAGTFTFTPTGIDYCVVGTAVNTLNQCTASDTICLHVNQPPVANDDVANTCEGQSVTIDPLSNDTDPEGNANRITVLSTAHGTSVLNGTSINYTPATNYNGQDTIIYTACNIVCPSNCDSGTIIVNICPVNNPPVVTDTRDTICKNGSITICPKVTDIDNNSYQVVPFACSGRINGTFALRGDSCFTFTPTAGWTGTQTFCIRVCDNFGSCDTATGTVVVLPANDPPLAAKVNLNICAGTPIGINIAGGVTDPNGDPLDFSYGIMTGPGAATWQVTGKGAAVFVSNTPGVYTMPYTVCDHSNVVNTCSKASYCVSNQIVITVIDCGTTANDSIKANDDGMVTTVNTPAIISELANDFYPNKGHGVPSITIIDGPHLAGSTAVLNADGTITYTSPNGGYDSLLYVICDPAPLCDTAMIRIFVDTTTITNYPPTAVDDFDTTDYKTPINVDVLRNDLDMNGNGIRVTMIPCSPLRGTAQEIPVTGAGTSIEYTPTSDGTALRPDTFCYQICNVGFPTLCDTARVVIYIRNSVVAVNDTVSTGSHNPIVIDVKKNDFDPEKDSFDITTVITDGTVGTVTWDTTGGTIRFAPNPDTCGFVDKFQYVIQDSHGAVDTATVFITIDCCPAPLAITDTKTILPGDQTTIYPFANDQNSDGISGGVLTAPKHGSAFFTDDTTLTYRSNPNYCGFDTIAYIGKSHCGLDTGLIIINIYCKINPIAVGDTEYLCRNDIINIPVLQNDTVFNNNHLRITDITDPIPPNLGYITEVTEDMITFATTGVKGTVRFKYTVCDDGFVQLCDTANIVIFIQDCPVPVVDTIYDTTYVNTPDTICIDQFVHVDGNEPVEIRTLCQPQHGSASADGECIVYTPDSLYVGNDTFCLIVCTKFGCDTTLAIITVLDTTKCFIPNAFSPNGDGVNDFFEIPCSSKNPKATLRLYDRWGMEVWDSNGPYMNNFKGENNQGILLPDGTYYLIYEYNDGTGKREARYVVISR